MAGVGVDVVWDLKTQKPYFAIEGEVGISPLSLFGTKSFLLSPQGFSYAGGVVFGMNDPNELSGRATSAVWHSRFLKLFGNVLASEHPANSAWSLLMTMAQKSSRQFVATVGVSTSGPAFIQFGSRTSFFASLDTWDTQFVPIEMTPPEFQEVASFLGDMARRMSVVGNTPRSLADNVDAFLNPILNSN